MFWEGRLCRVFSAGRTIGVPTANLDCGTQMVPLEGVYAGRCDVDGQTYPAGVSVGKMPTFGENLKQQIEAHLIGYDGDLYGRSIEVELIDWVRDQRKFSSIDALKVQISKDMAAVQSRVGLQPEVEVANK